MRLTEPEARARFAAMPVARFATVTPEGAPRLIPVTFAIDGDRIYTAVDAKPKSTRPLGRLRSVRANPRVAVLADCYRDDWSALWWARADGTAVVLDDLAAMTAPVDLLAARYPQYRIERPAGPVISISVSRWSGWSAS